MKDIPAPNYTQVPNYIMDHLEDFTSEAELKVVMVVARQTFGWRKQRDVISLSQLEEKTGMTRNSIVTGLERAIENGWIERIKVGQSFSYAVVVQKLDQSKNHTSAENAPEVVQKVDRQLVQNLYTQKKELKKEIKQAENLPAGDPVKDLAAVFEKAAGILLESTPAKSQGVVWWNPLRAMVKQANGAAPGILRETVRKMRVDKLTIRGPISCMSNFTSLNGERGTSIHPSGTVRVLTEEV